MIGVERLVSLALGDLDDAGAAEVDEHVLACTACATTLERLLRMGGAVRELVRGGSLTFPVTASFAERLRAEGLISRSYRLSSEAIVPCSVSATDIYALTTLEADLTGVTRATLVVDLQDGGRIDMVDIPFDVASGTVSYVVSSSVLRRLPSGRVSLSLYEGGPGERLLGRYFMQHTALSGS